MKLMSLPLLFALAIVAWLTAGAMAVRSVSRIWLRHWADRQLRGARAALTYLERPHRLLTAASAGVALTLLVAGLLIGIAGDGAGVLWASLAFGGIVVVVGQLVPRAVALRWPAGVAPFVLPVLRLTEVVTAPVVWTGSAIARLLVAVQPPSAPPDERDAIQDLLREGELEGVGERQESAIISGVVEFSEKVVREVMTPRSDIFGLPDGLDAPTLAHQVATSRYSRVPVYHGTLDDDRGHGARVRRHQGSRRGA